MRTIFYHIILCGTFIFGLFSRYPYLWFHKDPEKRYRFVTKTNKIWGRHILWGAASKVNVIYKSEAVKKEVEKIRDTREAIVLISNHQSNTDIPVLSAYLPIDFSFIAKKEMRKWPLIGYWMKCQDCIFLDRKNPRQGMKDMKKAEKKIANGHSFVIFPEGTRSEDGKVGEFKKGSFKLALDSNARILPVTLIGTYDIQKKSSLKVTPNKNVKMVVDMPINLDELSREDKKNIHSYVNNIIKENFEKYK